MKHIILAMLAGVPQPYKAAQGEHETIARAIDSATLRATCDGGWAALGCKPIWRRSRVELAAALVTIGQHESLFLERVQAGRCKPKECDALSLPGGAVFHRARTYWQVRSSMLVPFSEWRFLVGTDYISTTRSAWAAAKVYSSSYAGCRTHQGAFGVYAGAGCGWSGGKPRAARLGALLAKVSR